jgi:pilin isopeptide linkage protein
VSDTDGKIIFTGLTRGQTYRVKEITPPDGYALNANQAFLDSTIPAFPDAPQALSFTNAPIKTGTWLPEALKILDGKPLERDFAFELFDEGGDVLMTGTTDYAATGGAVTFTSVDGVEEEQVMQFENAHFFGADTSDYLAEMRTFVMREADALCEGYTRDETSYTLIVSAYNVYGQADLKVVIEDSEGRVLSDENGVLKPDKVPVFTNTYTASGTLSLDIIKELTGQPLEKGRFVFELYDDDGLVASAGNGAGAPKGILAENAFVSVGQATVTVDYTLDDVGTKVYTLKEKDTALSGYTYDSGVYTITVEIDDEEDNGQLNVAVAQMVKEAADASEPVDKILFENTYTAGDICFTPTARLSLVGATLEDGQFAFRLSRVDETGRFIEEVATVRNTGGQVTFEEMIFTQADMGQSFYYTIAVVDEGAGGYRYDNNDYTMRLDVVDNKDGTLRVEQTLIKNGAVADALTFYNAYEAEATLMLQGKKVLEGKVLEDGEFTFALQQIDAASGKAYGDAQTVQNKKDGIVALMPRYTQDDVGLTFTYALSEVNEGRRAYTYDNTVYTITVAVSDNGDGTLDLQTSLRQGSKDVENIVFVNKYDQSKAPLTGDRFASIGFAVVVMLAALIVFVMLIKRRRYLSSK